MGICSSRKSILLVLALILCHVSNAQRIVCDETCKLVDAPPTSATVLTVRPAQTNLKKSQSEDTVPSKTENNEYAVVSPVGYSSVEMISQADRLETLDAKRNRFVHCCRISGNPFCHDCRPRLCGSGKIHGTQQWRSGNAGGAVPRCFCDSYGR